MNNKTLDRMLHAEMSRKEFLSFSVFAFASIIGVAGVIRELTAHAATVAASAEPESGTLASCATNKADTTASGGHAVAFSACSSPAVIAAVGAPYEWASGTSLV